MHETEESVDVDVLFMLTTCSQPINTKPHRESRLHPQRGGGLSGSANTVPSKVWGAICVKKQTMLVRLNL